MQDLAPGGPISDLPAPPICGSGQAHSVTPRCLAHRRREGLMATKRARRTKRRPWSKEDVRELRAHSRSKSPVKKIVRARNRTAGARRQEAAARRSPPGQRGERDPTPRPPRPRRPRHAGPPPRRRPPHPADGIDRATPPKAILIWEEVMPTLGGFG